MAQAPQLLAGEPGTIILTLSQLRGIRGWWRKLAPAAAALRELGFTGQTDQVAAIAYAIGAARFAVKIPCITCSTPTPVDVGIGDPGNPEASGVVCGACRTKIDEQALADPADRGEQIRRSHAEFFTRHCPCLVLPAQEDGNEDF